MHCVIANVVLHRDQFSIFNANIGHMICKLCAYNRTCIPIERYGVKYIYTTPNCLLCYIYKNSYVCIYYFIVVQ